MMILYTPNILAALFMIFSPVGTENETISPYLSVWDNNNYLVSLVDKTSGIPFCLGTLISARTILTSASCLWKQSEVDPNGIEVCFSPFIGKRILVRDIITHDKYDPEEDHHDVALLFLEKFTKIFKSYPTKMATGSIGNDKKVYAIEMIGSDQIISRPLTVVNTTFYTFSAEGDYEKIPKEGLFGGPILNSKKEVVGVVPFLPKENNYTSNIQTYPKLEAYRFWIKEVLGTFRWFGIKVEYWPKFLVNSVAKK